MVGAIRGSVNNSQFSLDWVPTPPTQQPRMYYIFYKSKTAIRTLYLQKTYIPLWNQENY